MTPETPRCPRCGNAFSREQVEGEFSGICPKCLAGLMTTDPGMTEPGPRTDNAKIPIETLRPPLKPGASFKGFEVLAVLGQGGMGVVYKARQQSLNRLVALKLLNSQLAASEEFAARFDREAKVLASLNHPNVVQVFDFGKEDGLLYLVMEHVDGPTLEDVMKQKKQDPARFLSAVRDLARGLERVHAAGLVHRDIKPSNILIAKDGTAKISDFGLAVETEETQKLTQSGMFVGTPHYVSPEHAQGKKVDGRSDLYSLGVILFEGYAGRPPFQAASATALLLKHVNEPPPALYKLAPQSPKSVQEIVRRLLAKNPAARYDTASALVRDLDRAVEETKNPPKALPGTARKVPAPTAQAPLSKAPVKWIAGGVAAVALLAILIAVFSGKSEPPKRTEKPVAANRPAAPEPRREEEQPKEPEAVPAPVPPPLPAPAPAPAPATPEPRTPSAVEEALRQADKLFEQARTAYEDGKARTSVEALSDAAFKAEEAKAKYAAVQEIGTDELRRKAVEQVKLIQQFQKLVNESRLAILNSKGDSPAPKPVPAPPPPAPAIPAPVVNPAPAVAVRKTEAPDPSTLKDAEKTIREVYKAEYARKSPADQQMLAQKLLRQGRETGDDPKARFVLLREARDLAQQAGDLDTTLAAVDELAQSFDIDVLGTKNGALIKLSTAVRTPEAASALAEAFVDLARQGVDADNYDVAVAASTRADGLSKSSTDPGFAGRLQELRKEIAAMKDEYLKVKSSIDKPGSGEQEALGRYYAFVKGDWDRGLEILASAAKPPLNSLAERDLARPGEASARVEIGDGWWDLAEKEKSPLRKIRLQDRTRLWYEACVSGLTGLSRTRVEKRLEALESLNKGPVDLLRYVDPSKDTVNGTWTRTANALISGGGDFFSRVMVPYVPPAEYDLAVTVERRDGQQDFYMGLTQGDYQFGVTLNGGNSTYCEVQGYPAALTRAESGVLFSRPIMIVYQVRKNGIEVRVDGRKVLNYKGDLSKGSMYPQWAVPDKKVLFVGSHGSVHVVTRMLLTAVTGKGHAVRGVASTGAGIPPPASTRASVDLLALIDPAQDGIGGPVSMDGTKLVCPAEGSFTRVQIPYLPPAEYDLTVVAERKVGSNSLNLGLVVGESQCMVVLGGAATGDVSGLERIEGRNFGENETRMVNKVFDLDRRVTIVCSVRKTGVTVSVDGRTLIQWKGDSRRLDVWDRWQVPNKKALFIASSGTTYHISQMTLIPVTGQGTFLRKPAGSAPGPAKGSVDLLALVDPKTDSISGEWALQGKSLMSPLGTYARIQIPYEAPEEFDLLVHVERMQGTTLLMGLGGRNPVMATLDGCGGNISGLEYVDGKRCEKNETSWSGNVFRPGMKSSVLVSVRKSSVTVTVDDRKIVDWKGDRTRLSMPSDWPTPNPRAVWLGSWDSLFQIDQVVLTPVSGLGVVLRKAAGGAGAALIPKKPAPAPAPAKNSIDLLAMIDPKRDASQGEWKLEKTSLISPIGTSTAFLQIPYSPPEEYDLRIEAARRAGQADLYVGVVGGGKQMLLHIDGGDGSMGGLQWIDNKDWDGNETTYRGNRVFTDDKTKIILISVRRNSVSVTADGKSLIDWKADYKRVKPVNAVGNPSALYLGDWESSFEITQVQLVPVSGQGRKLR